MKEQTKFTDRLGIALIGASLVSGFFLAIYSIGAFILWDISWICYEAWIPPHGLNCEGMYMFARLVILVFIGGFVIIFFCYKEQPK